MFREALTYFFLYYFVGGTLLVYKLHTTPQYTLPSNRKSLVFNPCVSFSMGFYKLNLNIFLDKKLVSS